ncbi:hypothetical protein BGX30_007328 [Mortierella sp. GBA39]|nr:hypothetical protein BGX30_007328 [Mortierella sp. GBA39]
MFPKTQTCQASDGTEAEVPTIHYLPTLQYIIPWTNITSAFPNAYLVKHGDTILPFLSDKDRTRELLVDPLCIAYQENAVLEVILSVNGQDSSYSLDSSFYPTRQFRSTNALLDQFRLYYLCECGEHSRRPANNNYGTSNDKTLSHDIHLVEHEGYRIVDLPAFLEKYGVYTLAMLQMVKFGVSAGGMVVPRLLQFRAIQEGGHEQEESFEERVDFAIIHMQRVQQEQQQRQDFDSARAMTFSLTPVAPTSSSDDSHRTDVASWLQWEMFDELGSFLEDHDYDDADNNSSSTPGDLYKATSAKEGHVRWMCSTHYNELYPEVTRRSVLEAIQDNNGTFNERRGTAKVRIANAARGADFCWALSSSPFLQQIYIFLDWIATAADLKELVFAIQQSNLQQVELSVQTDSSATLQSQPTRFFLPVQLKNREGLAVSVRKWPNTSNATMLSLSHDLLNRREFPMLSELLKSSPHLTRICLCVDMSDFDEVLDVVEPFIEQSKMVEDLSLEMKDGSYVIMSYKCGNSTPSYVNARIPKVDNVTGRLSLEYITDLTLTGSHTLSEVDVLVSVLIACCTSLKRLSVVLASTHEHKSRLIPITNDGTFSENPQPITLSVFELGSIPTLASIALVHSVRQRTTFSFPMTKLNLKNLEIYDLSRLDKVLEMYPLVASLTLAVTDLDDAYGLVVPYIQRLDRHMTLRMEQKSGGNVVLQFKKDDSGSGSGSSVFDIQLRVGVNTHFRKFPLDQVKTLHLLKPAHVFEQHDQILETIRRCSSLETLEVCCGKALSLSTFCVGRLPAFKTLFLVQSDGNKITTQFAFPIQKLSLGKHIVSFYKKPSDLKAFFNANRELVDLSLTVDFIGKDFPVFLSTIKALQGQHRLSTFTLTDESGSYALITFASDNTITSYSLHLKELDNQEDLQGYSLSSITQLILASPCSATKQIDTLLQELLTSCPRLESIDVHCGSSYLKGFFLLCNNLTSLRKCVLRNSNGQVAPSLDLSETYLNLGNEPLLTTMYSSLVQTLQARPTITGLKILVESTFEAYEFFVKILMMRLPWLEEVKINQQSIGPKMVVSFMDSDDCDGGGGSRRVSSIALDVRSFSQLQPSMYPFLTKLTFSGQLKNWVSQELSQIPFTSCENLTTLELKTPPSHFPRILRSMHETSLMHPSLRQLKLWDGSLDNILTGTHIDDLDAISIRLQQVRMIDFQNSPSELEAMLQDYPLEIAHLELDSSFCARQAEIVEESLKVGKVRIRHVQWDISNTRVAGLFETMLRAVSHCHNSAASASNKNRMVPTVAFKVSKLPVLQSGLTMFTTSTSTKTTSNTQQQQHAQERELSMLGQFMTQFATHLILINTGLELFLPDLLATEFQALQELEIRVNRYCPDDNFLRWLKSVLQRGGVDGGEVAEVKMTESKVEEDKAVESTNSFVDVDQDTISDDYDSDFEFDDPMSSSIIVGDDFSTPSPTSALAFAFSPNPPTPGVLIPTIITPPQTTTSTSSSTRQALRRLTLHNLQFSPQQWKDLLESVDYLSLRSLHLERVGFSDQELIQLTRLYTDQITRARKQRKELNEIIGGETEEGNEEGREEEFVVRLYSTSVSQLTVDREHAYLKKNGCSQLKVIFV